MDKAKFRRMERLAPEIEPREELPMRLFRPPIDRIAEQRMADMRHMDANLVRTAGFEPAFDERRLVQRLNPAIMGHGMFAPGRFGNGHLLPVVR